MNTPRRIAAAILTAALSLSVVGAVATPADAKIGTSGGTSSLRVPDTTWP
ncbi:hypothetical protein [Nocardioides sp.]|nr:hypothetical protein [Nocardioides sp.]HXH80097.1 hypothetical protein [Nocardioides sp.]